MKGLISAMKECQIVFKMHELPPTAMGFSIEQFFIDNLTIMDEGFNLGYISLIGEL